MRIKSRNTAATTKRGNFAERQVKRLVAGADRRLAQTFFVTWSVDEAARRVTESTQARTKASERQIMERALDKNPQKKKRIGKSREQPKRNELDFFEEGTKTERKRFERRGSENSTRRDEQGVYLCKNEREAKELMQRFERNESEKSLLVAILVMALESDTQGRIDGRESRGERIQLFSSKGTKNGKRSEEKHQHKEGWICKIQGWSLS